MKPIKIFTPRRFTIAVILSTSLLLFLGILYSLGIARSAPQERNLTTRTFKDMPVVVRQVRNIKSETWFNDLEIEVKNVSAKPIYFMAVYIIFPDIQSPGNGKSGILLTYGNTKNGHISRYAEPTDEHLKPGETYVFTIPENFRKGLELKHRNNPEAMKNFVLKFSMINFGDGTGFEAGQSRNFKGKISEFKDAEEPIFKKAKWSDSTSTSAPPQDGCGGGNCFHWFVDYGSGHNYRCNSCPVILATINPAQPCSYLSNIWFDCDGMA